MAVASMQEADASLWKWGIEHVAIPLLYGIAGAIGWWVKQIADKFKAMQAQHEDQTGEMWKRINDNERHSNETFARRDDVRAAMQAVDGRLDTISSDVKDVLKMLAEQRRQ